MDRQIVYPGSIPLDTDLLNAQRNTMVALGYLTQMVLGTTTVADGLACTPTAPASMSVVVGPGSITQFGVIDTTPFGTLPALPANPLVRLGINIGGTSFALAAPTASGQVISYLIEATLSEADAGSAVLPYYNAINPAQPFSGMNNNGAPQVTERVQTVQLAVKPGPAVAIGSQNLPAVDAGWVGLYVVSVAYGQQTITAANITTLPTAPFVAWKLPQLSPGTHNLAVYQPTTQGIWTAPPGVSAVRLRIWGGGGAGGNGFTTAGGGGAGGGYAEGYIGVTPGQTFNVLVGNGGAGASGGPSGFGSLASAPGGAAGANGTSGAGGVGGGMGSMGAGLALSIAGSAGGTAVNLGSSWLSGAGGSSHGSPGALAANVTGAGANGTGPGSGAAGGVGGGAGGQGGPGLVLVEW